MVTKVCGFRSDNVFLDNVLYLINEPLQVIVQISCFLYIFWRKRLLNRGALDFLQAHNGGNSFVQKSVSQSNARAGPSEFLTQSHLFQSAAGQAVTKAPTIMIGMSEKSYSMGHMLGDDSETENKEEQSQEEDLEAKLLEANESDFALS